MHKNLLVFLCTTTTQYLFDKRYVHAVFLVQAACELFYYNVIMRYSLFD